MKLCWSCKKTKDLTEYHKDKSKNDGLTGCCKVCTAVRDKKKEKDRTPSYLFYLCRHHAKRRGYEFLLTKEEFLSFLGSYCRYCGISLDKIRLDRVDNKKGYILGNVVPCCIGCNRFKGNSSLEQLYKTGHKYKHEYYRYIKMARIIEKVLYRPPSC